MYSTLTDDELAAKVVELREKIETVAGGGAVAMIAGEGRRKEWTKSSIGDLRALLTDALTEQAKRANGGRLPGRAIRVRFTH